jgi:hypothetical protein
VLKSVTSSKSLASRRILGEEQTALLPMIACRIVTARSRSIWLKSLRLAGLQSMGGGQSTSSHDSSETS